MPRAWRRHSPAGNSNLSFSRCVHTDEWAGNRLEDAMMQVRTKNWDELHSRMTLDEGFGGAVILAFQVLIVAGLFLG
jgi:hypothetical protein